ncbi:SusC/RagA family TonB-linked outer membrane protein [Flavobacterium urocaniciphilum]|uniref:TonB-linked outer membrane protein, SusC/RagA family n=1 Tax=Flavobacterium urocaniciphilum TaxID=1299341 RepID=A0A1H9AWG8_9FLAO|nr:SusC/RagA family TonB-linked outer membrane protein [Flavobacterium urocaniciphilum]SEP80875.1 TonB-linked outer membrane protein, SusC/RagA family [Flavobacterium urocaniciphilum]
MRSKFKWIFTLLVALTMQFSFAQKKAVTGTVTSEGKPLQGAAVIIKGTKEGTQTDENGKFSIQAAQGDVLEFSYLEKETKTATVGASNTVNVTLTSVSKVIETIVVDGGYKSTTKATSVVSQSTVNAKQIEDRPNVNFLNSLQGQVAGANISSFSGQPGTNKIDVIIRGVSSLSASTDPLYVIDGVPMTQAFFRNLNGNEIESVTVLKDAAATAIYGNRATNGVISIRTKKGSFRKSFSVNYSSSYGLTEFRGDDYNLPNAIDHLKLQQKGFNEGVGILGSAFAVTGSYLGGAYTHTVDPTNLEAYSVNTNWKDIFFRTGTTKSHDLSFSAGSENLNNYTSLSYFDQDGIVPTTNFKRFTFRSNFNGKSTNEKFNYGLNVFGAYSKRNQLEQETRAGINSNVLQNPLTGYINSPAFVDPSFYQGGQQLFDELGNPALDMTPYMLMDLFGRNNAPSFFNEIKTIVTGNASYKLSKNLTASTVAGIDFADDKRNFAIGPNAYLSIVRASGAGQPFHGLENQSTTSEFSFNLTNKLTYKKTFLEKHTVEASVFQEYVKAHRKSYVYQQIGLNPLTWEPGAGTGYVTYTTALPLSYAPSVGASKLDAGLLSYFGSVDYDYDQRFGVAATIRRDATYRFVDDYKWGTFWSVAGRWNLSNEAFLKDVSWMNELKLRASYGLTGNQNIQARGIDSNLSTIFNLPQAVRDLNSVQAGYLGSSSFGVSSYANRDLRWEETAQWDLGVDFGIFKRLTGSFDYYNKRTTDLYKNLIISSANGIPNINANDGDIENKGIELALKYDVLKNTKFKLSVNANGAYNRSAYRTHGASDIDGDGVVINGGNIARIGGPLFEYFAVPYLGVNPANGNLLFLDINGNETESPTVADSRATKKSRIPKYTGGFGFNASYKGFFADALFTYSFGAWKYDTDYNGLMDIRNADLFPVSTDLFNAWTPNNTNTDVPALAATNFDSGDISDRFLRDASYVRVRNLTVGYSVPNEFLNKTFLKQVRFRVMAENMLTFTKWKGFDPESFVSSQTGYYPTPKIFTFGVDVNF